MFPFPFMMPNIRPIEYTDHGDSAPDSGTTTDTHTFNSKSVTRSSRAYVLLTYRVGGTGSNRVVSSATWGGNSMTIEVQANSDSGAEVVGVAILSIAAGDASGNVVVTFDGTANDSEITIVSTDNEVTGTVDTDTADSATTATLNALTAPPSGGARFAVANSPGDTSGMTWGNATEISDLDAGAYRHSAAADVSTNTSDITVASDQVAVGISVR